MSDIHCDLFDYIYTQVDLFDIHCDLFDYIYTQVDLSDIHCDLFDYIYTQVDLLENEAVKVADSFLLICTVKCVNKHHTLFRMM